MQPRHERLFSLFSKAGSNVFDPRVLFIRWVAAREGAWSRSQCRTMVACGWIVALVEVIAIYESLWQTPRDMTSPRIPVRLGPQGRLVVPVELRRELDLEEGAEMAIRSDGRRLILEPRSEVLRRLRRRFVDLRGISLADELVAERADEAQRESRE